MSKDNDLTFGLRQEDIQQKHIETITGKLIKSNQYDTFDYFNDEYIVELKSRRCNHNKYETTMIGYNKILKATQNKTYLFFFKFEDGLYYHKYDPLKRYSVKVGGRCDRGVPEYRDYLYIPIKDLFLV